MPRFVSPGPRIGTPIRTESITPKDTFEGAWADLRNRLKRGTEIKGWSREKDDTGLRFGIVEVGADAIVVLPAAVEHNPKPQSRRIGKSDFQRVYAILADYCEGKIKRSDTSAISQNTSYIFSIFHWRKHADT